ncbi:MmgE/PrpD family protein [Sphingomonas sp.]|uniref:MmgE/PrpD family protein n=1 Tax=Sphingomonas sp. TaxID=28214 RepID=UPI0025EAC677|nr:MmgE/PrpD family protein [Sphingomonas sp.]
MAIAATDNAINRPIIPSAPEPSTEAQRLADFALHLQLADVPAPVVAKAKAHMLDAFGLALAATGFDFAREILAGAKALGGSGDATALGSGERLPPANAALVNGALFHGLDFDDTHITAIYHATTPALAAGLAAAEATGASGKDLLAAFVVGLEMGCRIANAAEGGFHDRGFHPTALAGTFAAAFTAGRLLGLSRDQLVSALSFAGSQAAGILELGGSLKRLHTGWSAHAGYSAAVLAQNGFTGATTVFEGNHGFYKTHLGRTPDPAMMPSFGLGEHWLIEGIALKPYPCCHFIHAFVDAALHLREVVDVDQIARIDLPLHKRLHPLVGEPLARKQRPQSPYEAMFSTPYVVALALATGEVDLAAFHDRGVSDPRVLALAALAQVEDDPASDFPAHFPGEVRLTMKNGDVVHQREMTSSGTPDRPLSPETIEAKFLTNATRAITNSRASALLDLLRNVDNIGNVGELTTAARLIDSTDV